MTGAVEATIKQINWRVKGSERVGSEPGAEAILRSRADSLSETETMTRSWSAREARASGGRQGLEARVRGGDAVGKDERRPENNPLGLFPAWDERRGPPWSIRRGCHRDPGCAPGRAVGVLLPPTPPPKIGVPIDSTERAVKEYCRIEFRTVWNGAASRSMKIVDLTIGSR